MFWKTLKSALVPTEPVKYLNKHIITWQMEREIGLVTTKNIQTLKLFKYLTVHMYHRNELLTNSFINKYVKEIRICLVYSI